MSYKETKRYYFDRQSSVGPESDEIMTVNVPFVVSDALIKYSNFNFGAFVQAHQTL